MGTHYYFVENSVLTCPSMHILSWYNIIIITLLFYHRHNINIKIVVVGRNGTR